MDIKKKIEQWQQAYSDHECHTTETAARTAREFQEVLNHIITLEELAQAARMEIILLSSEKLLKSVNCRSDEEILQEAASRFEYFFKRANGDFEYPKCHPQIQQVLDMIAISVANK